MHNFCGGNGFLGFHKCGHFVRNCIASCVPVMSHSTNKYRRSTSLRLARKKLRDSARMSTFMRKKDAQNLPFHDLDTDELQKLSFNSLLRIQCKQNRISVNSLEVEVKSKDVLISNLEAKVKELQVVCENEIEKCSDLSSQLEDIKNSIYQQDQTSKNYSKIPQAKLKQLIDSAKLEMEFFATELQCQSVKPNYEYFNIKHPGGCESCGSQVHMTPPHRCKLGQQYSRQYKTKCASCGKPGHFTLLCRHLKKLL